jgi:hypothetical protein
MGIKMLGAPIVASRITRLTATTAIAAHICLIISRAIGRAFVISVANQSIMLALFSACYLEIATASAGQDNKGVAMLDNVSTNVCYCELCGAAIYDAPNKKLCNRCFSLRLRKKDVQVVYCRICGMRLDYAALTLRFQPDSRWCQCLKVEIEGYDFDRLESY